MTISIDGIYAGYMTASEGNGFAMFVFLNGLISGSDPGGVLFDGRYEANEGGFEAHVRVSVPSGGTVIQGASAGPAGMQYEVNMQLTPDFFERDYVRLETPLGPVNLTLKKIRSLESAV